MFKPPGFSEFLRSAIKFTLFGFCLVQCFSLFANDTIVLKNNVFPVSAGKYFSVFTDSLNQYNSENIIFQKFKKSENVVPVYTFPIKSLWIKFVIKNLSTQEHLYVSLDDPNISNIWFYEKKPGGLVLLKHTGASTDFNTREDRNYGFDFNLALPRNTEKEYYIRINSAHAIELPVNINSLDSLNDNNFVQTLIIGSYCGIILSVLLYNLFLFFATKDKSYLVYVIYLFTLGFAQITLAGWSFRFFWPSHPSINSYIVILTSCLAGIIAIAFAKSFLNTATYTPRMNNFLSFLIFGNLVGIILSLTSVGWVSYLIFNYDGLLSSVGLLYTSIVIYKKGYRPAYFYFIAWSVFFSCLIIYLLKNLNIVPTNNFTHFILYYASSVEAILLSFALADRINILKKEKEQSQAEALRQARENEQIVSEQNVILEEKVALRTSELQTTNGHLNDALNNLKDTQTQLVEAEKMASLGQLTAGIAHEINNPINFVKSNINPLRLDVKDLVEVLNAYDELHTLNDHNSFKQKLTAIEELKEDMDLDYVQKEIDSLIIGIEEGAERTAEIVRGLRTFSRIDEAALKTVNIHDGILSTIVLLKNNIPYYINLIKEFNAVGEVECFPGKLNQVFMNIITNAIQAIKLKPVKTDEETITIATRDIENDQVEILIKDTGPGMTEETKHRIFEPFFTTKDVGEGTGLGMAIVFKIIQKHEGKINIISAPNEGAEFVITLPHKYQGSD